MKLSKPLTILIGLATVWIVLYPVLFLAVWLSMMLGMGGFMLPPASAPEADSSLFLVPFLAIFPLHCLTMLLQMGLTVFYVVHVIKNTEAAETFRIILGVGLFLMPFVSMPIYYYLYVWLDEPPEWARREAGDSTETLTLTGSPTNTGVPDGTAQQ